MINRDSKDDYLVKNDSTITIKVAINKSGVETKENETNGDAISEHKSENKNNTTGGFSNIQKHKYSRK